MDRVFTELTPEVDYTAQLYAKGLEKKEIAQKKIKAISTINNQLQTAFETLKVRNGRELAIQYMLRIMVSILLFFGFTLSHNMDLRRPQRTMRIERSVRTRARRNTRQKGIRLWT